LGGGKQGIETKIELSEFGDARERRFVADEETAELF
jgi:hypothetical protein